MNILNKTIPISGRNLDLIEKYITALMFFIFVYRMAYSFWNTENYVTFLYMCDQIVIFIFILMRRKTDNISQTYIDWFYGFAGTLLPLLVIPPEANKHIFPIAIILSFIAIGFFTHIWAKLVLRRSFGVVAANRGVKISGPYEFVRHPMYLGYSITLCGLFFSGPNLWNTIIIVLAIMAILLRISKEENILKEDDTYKSYCERTKYRLIPGIY